MDELVRLSRRRKIICNLMFQRRQDCLKFRRTLQETLYIKSSYANVATGTHEIPWRIFIWKMRDTCTWCECTMSQNYPPGIQVEFSVNVWNFSRLLVCCFSLFRASTSFSNINSVISSKISYFTLTYRVIGNKNENIIS